MTYTVKTTESGYVEELTFESKTYRMTWEADDCGFRSVDKEFNEQLEEDGVEDIQLLNAIWDLFDCNDVGSDMYKIEEEFM